jgi:hypothetical protein
MVLPFMAFEVFLGLFLAVNTSQPHFFAVPIGVQNGHTAKCVLEQE